MSRRGVYRGIFSAMLDDPDYQRLTSDARLVLLTLRLCAQAGAAAIFRFYPTVLAEQAGLEIERVEKALIELSSSPSSAESWVVREGPIVWVRNGLRYDPNLRLADPKHRKSVERAVQALPRLDIVASFCEYYGLASPFEDSPEGLPRVSEDLSSPNTKYRVPNTETEEEIRGARQPLQGQRQPFSRKRIGAAWGQR